MAQAPRIPRRRSSALMLPLGFLIMIAAIGGTVITKYWS